MEKKGFWLAGIYLSIFAISLIAMNVFGTPSSGKFGLSVDIGVTGTAVIEFAGGSLILASFIRDRHKQQGKEEERGENQRFVEKLKLEGKIDEETAKRLIERK